MGEQVKDFGNEFVERWNEKMPKFFRTLLILCAFVAGLALTINTAVTMGGGTLHEWWTDIYPYLLGIPAGMAFACKFTVSGGFKGKADIDKLTHNTILDKDNF